MTASEMLNTPRSVFTWMTDLQYSTWRMRVIFYDYAETNQNPMLVDRAMKGIR